MFHAAKWSGYSPECLDDILTVVDKEFSVISGHTPQVIDAIPRLEASSGQAARLKGLPEWQSTRLSSGIHQKTNKEFRRLWIGVFIVAGSFIFDPVESHD